MIELLQEISAGNLLLRFYKQDKTVCFSLLPSAMAEAAVAHRTTPAESEAVKGFLQRFPMQMDVVDSMVQFKLNSDPSAPQMFPGRSMRCSGSVSALEFAGQQYDGSQIITDFKHPSGVLVRSVIGIVPGKNHLTSFTRLVNNSEYDITVEYLAGCSIGMLSPFQSDDGAGKYFIHRLQSAWSAEGRPLEQSIEEANLEMSWQAAGLRNIRFGVNGSMPVRGFFPFAAFEDRQAGVFWGVQAEATGSWELEIARTGDFMNLSGGYPGRESSGWTKILRPGESCESMKMILACVHGSLDELCACMKEYQDDTLFPKSNRAVFFNEYCTTWGRPWQKYIETLVEPAKAAGADYFIMDAGWFRNDSKVDRGCVGDWSVKEEMYPSGGFAGMVEKIRSAGLIPGIWFEFEVCLADSRTAQQHPEWFLTLDGFPIMHGPRMFLDLRKPEVVQYLRDTLFDFLEKYRIGYMKVDYNGSTAGLCDGPESPAENHRQYMECIQQFYAEIKQRFPELVLEICASGGNRMTPGWSKTADVFSVSDAHEGAEIPLIAANVQRIIPAYKCLNWATVRPWNDEKRLYYLLCGAFLGRFCLSGDIDKLSMAQMQIVHNAVSLYRECSDIICRGSSSVEQHWNCSFNHPQGWQKVSFSLDGQKVTVLHVFGEPPPSISFDVENVCRVFAPQSADCKTENGLFVWCAPEEFSALVLIEK